MPVTLVSDKGHSFIKFYPHQCNWRYWKKVELVGEEKERLTMVCDIVEEEGGKCSEPTPEPELSQLLFY